MNLLRKILTYLLILVIILTLITAIWIIWERNRDPINAINYDPGKVVVKKDSSFSLNATGETRNYRYIQLSSDDLGEFSGFISQPSNNDTEKLPVVFILGGLEIGVRNFKFIGNPGNNIVVIYQFSYSPDDWEKGTIFTEIPLIRKTILQVPAEVLVMINWLSQQKWVDSERINISGYSFGAMFVPSVYHLANYKNVKLGYGVISYGGVDIYDLLVTNMPDVPEPFRSLFAYFSETGIYPMEPALHLPYMNNEFLVINGKKDDQISEYSWRTLHKLIPEPKTIMLLDEGHMHPNKPQLTKKLVDISKEWLLEKGILNP